MKMRCKSMDKPKQRKGLWSPEEDRKLRNHVLKHGHACWTSVPLSAGFERNGKSCRLRWINYLRPGSKRGTFSEEEGETILNLHRLLGNKWSQIAQHLTGRTDNEIKNYWHSNLKKKLVKQACSNASTSYENTKSSSSQQNSSLAKILFAEWLSPDNVHNENIEINNSLAQNSNIQDLLMCAGLGCDCYSVSEIFSLEFKIDDQQQSREINVNFQYSEDDLWSHFNINNIAKFI